jgi:hypothetical protein
VRVVHSFRSYLGVTPALKAAAFLALAALVGADPTHVSGVTTKQAAARSAVDPQVESNSRECGYLFTPWASVVWKALHSTEHPSDQGLPDASNMSSGRAAPHSAREGNRCDSVRSNDELPTLLKGIQDDFYVEQRHQTYPREQPLIPKCTQLARAHPFSCCVVQ